MRWLLLLALVLLLNACSDDAPGDQKSEPVRIGLMSYTSAYDEEQEIALTRAWTPPTDYVLYEAINDLFPDQKNLTNSSIGIFFTKDNTEPLEGTFYYREHEGANGQWYLTQDVDPGEHYLYGFIPREDANSASIVSYNGTAANGNASYSNGAVLTIHGLNTVTVSDVCVLIGAKEGPNVNSDETTDGRLRPGYFKTKINPAEGAGADGNFIYLLFDHLYAALKFRFKVDADYAALRTIRLRKLELIAYKDANQESVASKFDAEITLKKTDNGTTPIVGDVKFTPVGTTSVPQVPIFDSEGIWENEVRLDPDTPSDFVGRFVPGNNTYFKLRSHYDVYDNNTDIKSEGNLIRKECQVENTIDLTKWFGNDLTTTRGHSYTLTMKVQPTYLYMLSDPDLDNPTVTIATE